MGQLSRWEEPPGRRREVGRWARQGMDHQGRAGWPLDSGDVGAPSNEAGGQGRAGKGLECHVHGCGLEGRRCQPGAHWTWNCSSIMTQSNLGGRSTVVAAATMGGVERAREGVRRNGMGGETEASAPLSSAPTGPPRSPCLATCECPRWWRAFPRRLERPFCSESF